MSDLLRRLAAMDHFVLVARLTLLLTIFNTDEDPVQFVAAIVATAALFLRPDLLRSPWPWLGLAAVIGFRQWSEWWVLDDHAAVTTYWLLALGLSRFASDPDRVAAVAARFLVGLVFAFAFGWKLLSSQYTSTDFFRYELLVDDRFELVAEQAGGTDEAMQARNFDRLERLYQRGEAGDSAVLEEGDRNSVVANVFTWWGIAIEGFVAVTFLLPLRGRWALLRPAALFGFAYTTYAVVPIAGFGALLMMLGLAHQDRGRLRAAFVLSFAALAIWGAVFPQLL